MADEYHQDQLRKRCRVCCQLLINRKSRKITVYVCSSNQEALLSGFHLDVSADQKHIHPEHFCNTCNTKMRQYNANTGIKSEMVVSVWELHTDDCKLCEEFKRRGRPKKLGKDCRGTIEQLNRSTAPSWGDPQPLTVSRFLPPGQGISIHDLQCILCKCVADRSVQNSCGKLLCHKCMGVHFKAHASNFPCCETSHSPSSFIPAPEVLVKIISVLVLRCSTCNSSIELRRIREHTASGCVHTIPPSPSRLTLGQIMSQPADAPLMAVEKKLATSMVKRILNTSPQQSSSTDIISLPTAGQVCKHIKTHTCISTTASSDFIIPATDSGTGDKTPGGNY